MKSIRSFLIGIFVTGSLAVSLHLLPAQEAAPVAGGTDSTVDWSSASDLEVELQAVESLPTIPATAAPQAGTFYSAQHAPGSAEPWPPMPANIRDVPLWSLGDNIFLLSDLTVNYDQPIKSKTMAKSGGMMTMEDVDLSPGDGDTNDDGGGYTNNVQFTPINTNGLWLQITNVSGGVAYLNLMNATDSVYEVMSKENLLATDWDIIGELFPTNATTNVMPFTVAANSPTNLFVWAMDWTGVTSDGNTTPEWWFWKYFGTTDLSDTNLDSTGDNTLLYDYQNGVDPNVIEFSLQFTNNYVNSSLAYGGIAILGGEPIYYAVLVNDTNLADASWQPYTSTNIPVTLGSTDGVYGISVGLRGLPSDAQQTWQTNELIRDTVPPVIVLTNPVSSTVSVPMIQVQGFANENLSSLTFDVSNAVGVVTNQTGYWQPVFYDTNLLNFTTNIFQCYDVPLTNGLNQIAVHAFDLAGNETTTNVNVTVDYSGDTTPPALTVLWPTNGTSIGGNNFTLQVQVDDYTATVTASIVSTNGATNTVQGLVERSGLVWVDGLPLASGTNVLTITATDAAGNMSTTSLNVFQSAVDLTVDPISDDQLNQTNITVTGTISDGSDNVWVNGIEATTNGDGTWEADAVPVSASGTAVLDVQAGLSTNSIAVSQTLNQPQSAKVGLMSYSIESSTGVGTETFHWNYLSGGEGKEDNVYGDHEDTSFPLGDAGAGEVQDSDLYEGDVGWAHASFRMGFEGGANMEIDTHLMIEPSGQAVPGAVKSYIVEAQVQGYYDSTGGGVYESQLNPQAVQIRGMALTSVTNSNGSVWGEALVSAPAGATVDVTPSAPVKSYSFNNTFLVKTKEDWQNDVRNEIYSDTRGVADMNTYNPANGFMANRQNLQAVYAFYQKLFTENGNLLWAGLGKLAGAPVYAGLSDAQFLIQGEILIGSDTNALTIFQNTLITMNTNILQDLAWQSEAYYKGGLQALNVVYAGETNALDLPTINAWREIDDGVQNNIPSEIQAGNLQLAHREQLTVLQPNYDTLNTVGGVITNAMSILAQNPVPTGTNFLTVVPSGNLCTFPDRWNWITNSAGGIWPNWVAASPTTQSGWVNIPLTTRAANYAFFPIQ